ncbi:MAG TPA: hypothetical protein VG013_05625 [Gemmataceae bacterium]|nr:hypothetical protein [Gemmataceae bacterium]
MNHRRIAAELERLDASGPVTVQMTAGQAWAVLSNLQLAFRQPGNTGPARKVAEQVARGIQGVVAPRGSGLAELAERGWGMSGQPSAVGPTTVSRS